MRPDPGGFVEKNRLLKSDAQMLSLELGREGKFAVKSRVGRKTRCFLPGDQLRLEVVSGQWVPTRWHSEARAWEAVKRGRATWAGGLAAAIAYVAASQCRM
jgi:hypothetical protein